MPVQKFVLTSCEMSVACCSEVRCVSLYLDVSCSARYEQNKMYSTGTQSKLEFFESCEELLYIPTIFLKLQMGFWSMCDGNSTCFSTHSAILSTFDIVSLC